MGCDFFKKPAGVVMHETCAGSNQRWSEGPGLPASPQPGLVAAHCSHVTFFVEKHVDDLCGNKMSCVKQRGNYTIRIDVVYRFAMVVSVGYVQYPATRGTCGVRVI